MQIKIEIDLKPEELARILGIPDVTGLQDDVIRFLRDKINAAGESFDPSAVIQGSFDLIKRTPPWRKLRDVLTPKDEPESGAEEKPAETHAAAPATAEEENKPAPRAPRKRSAKKAARKRAAGKRASSKSSRSDLS
jgi:hypothetical protein